MRYHEIIAAFGYVIYAALALLAVWGVYNAILLYRSLGKKSIGRRGAAAPAGLELARRASSTPPLAVARARPTGTRRWRSSWPWR